jgi:Mg-chelatase subunit ChlD
MPSAPPLTSASASCRCAGQLTWLVLGLCLLAPQGAAVADRSDADLADADRLAGEWLREHDAERVATPDDAAEAIRRLAPHTEHARPKDWPLYFYTGGEENAYCAPYGVLYCSESLHDQLRDLPPVKASRTQDEVIAFIVAHEMSHYLHGDVGLHDGGVAGRFYEVDKVDKDRVRMQEKQADESAVRLLSEAGYGWPGIVGALAFATSTWVAQQGDGTDRYYWEAHQHSLPDHGTASERRRWIEKALLQALRDRGESDADYLTVLEGERARMERELQALDDDLRGANREEGRPLSGSPLHLRPELSARSPSMDLIFVIDSTGSMHDDIAEVRGRVTELLSAFGERIESADGTLRTAVVAYKDRDADEDYLRSWAFSEAPEDARRAIAGIVADGGGDPPEDVYAALLSAISTEEIGSWRDGVRKIIILMGDAPPKDRAGGPTLNEVAKRAEEVDPAHVHTILTGNDHAAAVAFEAIAEATGGTFRRITDASALVDALIDTIAEASGQPRPATLTGGGAPPAGASPHTGSPSRSVDWTWSALWLLLALLGMATVALVALLLLRSSRS